MSQPFRFEPKMSAAAYKTYAIRAPIQTHTRPARCEEVACPNHAHGWVTRIDTSQTLGQEQAKYIAERAGRAYVASVEGELLVFTFPSGQQCFAEHRTSLERDPTFLVRDGDYRGNPTGHRYVHTRAEDWVDDFATHQDNLTKEIEKG